MNLNKEIFINVSAGSTRIAIVENEVLVELHIDIADHKRMVGNIYKGVVQNVIPGMQAAFIDIGQEINAFLPFSDSFLTLGKERTGQGKDRTGQGKDKTGQGKDSLAQGNTAPSRSFANLSKTLANP